MLWDFLHQKKMKDTSGSLLADPMAPQEHRSGNPPGSKGMGVSQGALITGWQTGT